ncbi:MAG: hypothetical protein J6U65_00360, partial [Bacteroidaceae bacterium]|nr:hypothetical protein [Bacteroidaceae bacterium]
MNLRSLLLCMLASCATIVSAQDVLVYFKSGNVNVYPSEIVKSTDQDADALRITLNNDSVITFAMAKVASVSNEAPQDLPVFTSFKFNNKYNDQVFTDVEATITPDTIRARVGAIGKWLTPSFNISDDHAKVW